MNAYDHQDVPFDKLLKELRLEQDLSRNPLFQVMFALHTTSDNDLELDNLAMNSFSVANKTAKFDLAVYFVDTRKRVTGT